MYHLPSTIIWSIKLCMCDIEDTKLSPEEIQYGDYIDVTCGRENVR